MKWRHFPWNQPLNVSDMNRCYLLKDNNVLFYLITGIVYNNIINSISLENGSEWRGTLWAFVLEVDSRLKLLSKRQLIPTLQSLEIFL